jgi:membrane protein YdbS with pleckstrin-like domain
MNSKHEQPAEKTTLEGTLLALDCRMPSSSVETREVAQKVLRRDRRRIRILTWTTISLFLLMVIGICGSIYWYHIKVWPTFERIEKSFNMSASQIHDQEPDLSKRSPQTDLAMVTSLACRILYQVQLANLWGIIALFVVMLVAACCTILLIRTTRGATLRQIQASLLLLSEQIETLRQTAQPSQLSTSSQNEK